MSIFYLTVRNVNRAEGRSAVGAAAYCSRSRLRDETGGHVYDFRMAEGLVHTELVRAEGAPGDCRDREAFWNAVEAGIRGENEVPAWEVEAVVPGRLPCEAAVSAARAFVTEEFLAWGIATDLSLHRVLGADGQARIVVHVLVPLRQLEPDGAGRKQRPWIGERELKKWREHWARLVNFRLIKAGVGTLIGVEVGETRGRCLELDVACDGAAALELRWRNGERIIAEPGLAFDRLLQGRAEFTQSELAALVRDLTVGEKQYTEALVRVQSFPGIVRLGAGETGEELFGVRSERARRSRGAAGRNLGDGEVPEAGAEVYAALRAAAEAWEKDGLRARGVGLTYERAKRFERATGIRTAGVHGLLGRWKKKKDLLDPTDVLVVTDVAELSDVQKTWMLKAVRRERAKLALVSGQEFVLIEGTEMGLDARQTAAMAWRGSPA